MSTEAITTSNMAGNLIGDSPEEAAGIISDWHEVRAALKDITGLFEGARESYLAQLSTSSVRVDFMSQEPKDMMAYVETQAAASRVKALGEEKAWASGIFHEKSRAIAALVAAYIAENMPDGQNLGPYSVICGCLTINPAEESKHGTTIATFGDLDSISTIHSKFFSPLPSAKKTKVRLATIDEWSELISFIAEVNQ